MTVKQYGELAPITQAEVEFDHVPELRELLPNTGGLPGIIYAQVIVANITDAQAGRWPDPNDPLDNKLFAMIHPVRRPEGKPKFSKIRGAVTYRIRGPKGAADVELMGSGRHTPGIDFNNGRRRLLNDPKIYELTGHTDPDEKEIPRADAQRKPSQAQAAPAAPEASVAGGS